MKLELEKLNLIEGVRYFIQRCQNLDHVQQVAYSTYHDSLTQICFQCKKVRTNLNEI